MPSVLLLTHRRRLDERDDGSELQSYLGDKTGQRTVPNIFISQRRCLPTFIALTSSSDQKHVGGCDAVMALNKEGKLAGLVNA
jgi:glutaredoxin 3